MWTYTCTFIVYVTRHISGNMHFYKELNNISVISRSLNINIIKKKNSAIKALLPENIEETSLHIR